MARKYSSQRGITLVIALVMLVVLSLLVVSAIRFGIVNLKIAGNTQTETEAVAAAQLAVESKVLEIAKSPNISAIPAAPASAISTGGKAYNVAVDKPACTFTKNITNAELDATKPGDQMCFENADSDVLIDASGNPTSKPTACKQQQWDVTARVADGDSGAAVTVLQGVAVRVSAAVSCP